MSFATVIDMPVSLALGTTSIERSSVWVLTSGWSPRPECCLKVHLLASLGEEDSYFAPGFRASSSESHAGPFQQIALAVK